MPNTASPIQTHLDWEEVYEKHGSVLARYEELLESFEREHRLSFTPGAIEILFVPLIEVLEAGQELNYEEVAETLRAVVETLSTDPDERERDTRRRSSWSVARALSKNWRKIPTMRGAIGGTMLPMIEFKLPVLSSATRLEHAFKPMINSNVSGVVVDTGNQQYRMLHFAVLENAFNSQVQELGEITGGIPLEFDVLGTNPAVQYDIVNIVSAMANVRSLHEFLSYTYAIASPGYVCSGPAHHSYPPLKRGAANTCVVAGCPGLI
jgi:hypothetical protein